MIPYQLIFVVVVISYPKVSFYPSKVMLDLPYMYLCMCKGSFTYYVITKGEGGFRNDYANVIFALSNAEFDYGRGEGVWKPTKSDYVICERSLS